VLQLIAEELLARPGALAVAASVQGLAAKEQQQQQPGGPDDAARAPSPVGSAAAPSPRGVIPGPDSAALRELYRKLRFDPSASAIDRAQAAEALGAMGFKLMPSEISQLVDMMDTSRSGRVRRAAFAASQIDWRHLQQDDVEAWIEIARAAFSSLDKDRDGGERFGAAGLHYHHHHQQQQQQQHNRDFSLHTQPHPAPPSAPNQPTNYRSHLHRRDRRVAARQAAGGRAARHPGPRDGGGRRRGGVGRRAGL
jgi:hypothetical protein